MIAWMLEVIVASSLLMILVLVVRRPVAELLGAQWAYALWLLPVLIPLLPSVHFFAPIEPAPMTIIIPDVSAASAISAAPAPESSASADWLLMLVALWLGGALAFAAWQQSAYSAFMLHLGPRGRDAQPPEFGGVRVVESDAVDGPVAVGLFRRRIVVPIDFLTRYSPAEQRLALEHELVHHRRLDLFWNWIGLGLLTINWFNPIAHFAFRAFRADQELSCDAAVALKSPAERHDYACALVKSASQPGLVAVCPLNHADMLKRRLRMMKKHRASWARTGGGVAVISALGVAGFAVATPGFAEERAEVRVVANSPQERDPVIAREDIARLREKCGAREQDNGDAIVCSSDEAKDPEVRAIMDKTMKRVKERVEDAKLSRSEMRRIRRSAEKASRRAHRIEIDSRKEHAKALADSHKHIILIERGEHMEVAREALERARIEIARMDHHKIRRDALASLSAARVIEHHGGMTRKERERLREALDEARREIENMEIDIRIPEVMHFDLDVPEPPEPPEPPEQD